MGEFSINTDQISSLSDLLEQQAKALENAGGSIDSIKNNLNIHGAVRGQIMSAMRINSDTVREEAAAAGRMGKALRDIAESYRSAENRILGNVQRGNGNAFTGGGGNGGGAGGGGGRGGSQNGKNSSSTKYSSDPVNLNTGNFILDNHDMEVGGFQPLKLGRFYNSMSNSSGMLGKDWNLSFEMKLYKNSDHYLHGADLCVMREDGREEYFVLADGKQYLAMTDTTSELEHRENGYFYRTIEGDCYQFDEEGKYIRFENPHHVGFNLLYNGKTLSKVEKDSGEFFEFSYGDQGFLNTVEDHTGRTCQYLFEEGNLTKVILPDGNSYQYFYNQSGKIRRVVNPRNVNAVETEYDDLYRVVYQKFADGATNQFEYRDEEQAVLMTERDGSRSIHYHNEKYQNIRNVYSDGEESFEYNERGLKTLITDKLGNSTRFQYDNKGNLTGIIRADRTRISATYNQQNNLLTLSVNGKQKVRNQYNSFGDLISTEDGIGRKTTYFYDELGRIIKVEMPDQTIVEADYDERGNLRFAKAPNGGILKFEYDALNQVIRQTDAMGYEQSCEYDVMGRILSETRPDGCSRYYQYDEWGNIVRVQDYDGSVETCVYNENNKPISMGDAAGRETCFEYDEMWNVSKVLLPNGGVFQYLYNKNNRLECVKDAEGNETIYHHDPMGNLLCQTNPEGAKTSYQWDEVGRCTKIIDADGTSVEIQYDEEDRIIYVKDAEDVELFRIYDEAGQLIEERDSLGKSRSYVYDAAGDLISFTDEKGHTTCYRYAKGLHKVEEILYPNGTKEQYSYDLNGNVATHTDIHQMVSRYQYDNLNRIIALATENGEKRYEYDQLGRITREVNFEGNATTYEYSVTGQLTAVTDALGNTTRYSYDRMDRLVEVLRKIPDSEKEVRLTYERNKMGAITKLTDAMGRTESYQYNGLGRLTQKVDRENQCTKYSYNSLGLLESTIWQDGRKAEYRYNTLRRLSEVKDWTGVTQVEYDHLGHPLKITYPDNRTLTIGYDSHGNRSTAEYPNGRQIVYEYDELDRLKNVIQGENSVAYTYDELGNIASRKLSNGSEIQYSYNREGRLSSMTFADEKGVLDEFSCVYDKMGRRIQYGINRRDIPDGNGRYEYAYDPVGRLLEVSKDQKIIRSYTYDELGNRSSMTSFDPLSNNYETTKYEHDLNGGILKLIRPGFTEEYQYDQRGNLTKLIKNGLTDREYTYDVLSRLTRSQNAKGEEAVYHYNGLGYRVGMDTLQNGQKKSISYTLDYSRIYDNLLEQKEDNKTESYFWGNGMEGFVQDGGTSGWYLTDSLGSMLRKVDEQSTLAVKAYDEFGNLLSGDQGSLELFGYNGFRFDPIAGTYFAQAREYRSYTGTFDGMDKFGGDITMPDTLLPYAYCVNDPFSHTDKSAYWFGIDDAIAGIVGFTGGIASQFIGDVIDGFTTGNFEWSSWQEYVGSGLGGTAGGIAALYGGPVVSGAVSEGVKTLTTEGLTWISDPSSYDKTLGDVLWSAAKDAGMGGIMGGVSKFVGDIGRKIAGSKLVQQFTSKLNDAGGILSKIANKITDFAHGKPKTTWDAVTKLLKNQHGTIMNSFDLKRGWGSFLLKKLPKFIFEEVGQKLKKSLLKLIPTNLLALLGFDAFGKECAAAS